MLATLVIGLREGLEASLIVGIIAAFLRKNGMSLTAMWLGVGLAVALSIAVGIGLDVVEQALPQAEQEGMEAIIGAIAIFFVTGMIAWMNAHARDMKRQLEAEAAAALSQTGAYALASMAFLAVLKEGFETSVFLLATFSAAQSALLAAAGAIIGLLLAVVIGWGIYAGGVRINLSRFFRVTGSFLILVAAGLVVTALRTAHEAGWINAGQQATVNLSWLVAPGSVRSALITGVLGIPADPRLIEVIGWFAYLVPVAIIIYWPASRRPQPRTAARLRLAAAAVLAALALGLAVFYPRPRPQVPAEAALVAPTDASAHPVGTARLVQASDGAPAVLAVSPDGSRETRWPLPGSAASHDEHAGVAASRWHLKRTTVPAGKPSMLTLDQVVALYGGRIPVGLNPGLHPGPFKAEWSIDRSVDAWTADGVLLDADGRSTTIVALSGSGLQTPRTFAVRGPAAAAGDWRVAEGYRDRVVEAVGRAVRADEERQFWAVQLPGALAIAAFLLAAWAARTRIRLRRLPAFAGASAPTISRRADPSAAKGTSHAAR